MNSIDYKLTGKYALITGATHGIGLSICRKLASLGCKIAFTARSLGPLKDLSKELNDTGVENIFFKQMHCLKRTVIKSWMKLILNGAG